MSFTLYLIGFIILLAGLVAGAYLLNVPQTWIGVGVLVLVGVGVMSAVARTRIKDR